MDYCVAVEGQAVLKQGDIEQKMEHGNPRPLEKPNTLEGNDHNHNSAEDLVRAQGSGSGIRVAIFLSSHQGQRPI